MIVVASSSAKRIKAGVHLRWNRKRSMQRHMPSSYSEFLSKASRASWTRTDGVRSRHALCITRKQQAGDWRNSNAASLSYSRIPVFLRQDHTRKRFDVLEQIDSCHERSMALCHCIGSNVGTQRHEIMHMDSSRLYIHSFQSPGSWNPVHSRRDSYSHSYCHLQYHYLAHACLMRKVLIVRTIPCSLSRNCSSHCHLASASNDWSTLARWRRFHSVWSTTIRISNQEENNHGIVFSLCSYQNEPRDQWWCARQCHVEFRSERIEEHRC